jgi:hypothetical protein
MGRFVGNGSSMGAAWQCPARNFLRPEMSRFTMGSNNVTTAETVGAFRPSASGTRVIGCTDDAEPIASKLSSAEGRRKRF